MSTDEKVVMGVVVAEPVATAPPVPTTTCALSVYNEFPSVLANTTAPQQLITMLHIDAPKLDSLADRQQGIVTSAVIDISGSMRGEKMTLVKEAMTFMISQLTDKDSFGIIAFATGVEESLPLTKMNAAGKELCQRVIDGLAVKDCTNLSGGLFAGIDQVCGKPFAGSRGPEVTKKFQDPNAQQAPKSKKSSGWCFPGLKSLFSRKGTPSSASCEEEEKPAAAPPRKAPSSVLLFTDGQANEGISNRQELLYALKTQLLGCPHVCVHTFGFGGDHDATMLQCIAEQSQGSYYFIKDTTVLKDSFADCLGGLISVVCTQIRLQCVVQRQRCKVVKLMTKFPSRSISDDVILIEMKDLYSGESRDVPIVVDVSTEGCLASETVALADWIITYYSPTDSKTHEHNLHVNVVAAAEKYSGAPNAQVDEQRSRFVTAESIEEARRAAEARDFTAAREKIAAAQRQVKLATTGGTEYSAALCNELNDVMACCDEATFAVKGQQQMSEAVSRQYQQRCNSSAVSAMYATSWKTEMKKMKK